MLQRESGLRQVSRNGATHVEPLGPAELLDPLTSFHAVVPILFNMTSSNAALA